jgi:tellurite methyltransferase
MTDQFPGDPPSPFVLEWGRARAPVTPVVGRALDVAAGRGRHSVALARLGWRMFAVDADAGALRSACDRAAIDGLLLRAWCADLTQSPLPRAAFDMVVVARYLQRSLFGTLRDAVVPGGTILYETFTVNQRALGFGPGSADHLLDEGELLARFAGFDVLFYEEVKAPEAVARLAARRPK